MTVTTAATSSPRFSHTRVGAVAAAVTSERIKIATIGSTWDAGAGFCCIALGAVAAPPVSGVARELPAAVAAAGAIPEPEALTSEPDQGSATYGNVPETLTSFVSTPSPRRSFGVLSGNPSAVCRNGP